MSSLNGGETSQPLPRSLLSRNPLAWLTVFGPGAVIASLTIGSGELIFSTRGGALFGYRLLWFFAVVLALKWALVYVAGRHSVLTGAHPFQRWMDLPGPRGWLPLVLLLLALVCFPVWVSFHAGAIGTLLSWLTGTEQFRGGEAYHFWGMALLGVVLLMVFSGSYARLEKIQLVIVLLMLLCVVISLLLVRPDWGELVKGLLVPQPLAYPDWISAHREFASRPVWVETITYVGVIGGSGYDYLAYVSYLRGKQWGRAGRGLATSAELEAMAGDPGHIDRRWVRAPLVDCTLSFLAVLVFSGVFVACGAVLLGPQQKVPGGTNLLVLQADFVTAIAPWLRHLYFVGAFLAMFGTLYGTIEVAPTVLREVVAAFDPATAERLGPRLRLWSVWWVGLGGFVVLGSSLLCRRVGGAENPPGLIGLLTPANLFTGVLLCGFICWLNVWTDRRFLPMGLRLGWPLALLNLVAGAVFVGLGLKGYYDHSGWMAFGILAGTLALGWVVAWGARSAEKAA